MLWSGKCFEDAVDDQSFSILVHGGDIVEGGFGVNLGRGDAAELFPDQISRLENRCSCYRLNGIKA